MQLTLFLGRIVVQFEEHSASNHPKRRPVVQLRVLELLTPVLQVGEIAYIDRREPAKQFLSQGDMCHGTMLHRDPYGRLSLN